MGQPLRIEVSTWGLGVRALYSNDIAKDLKSTIAAVTRLPLDTDELVGIISSSFPEAANDANDEDHTTFWLVLADQLHRKGIESRDAFDRAIEIVDSGKDLNMPAVAEMEKGNQRKRETASALCAISYHNLCLRKHGRRSKRHNH